VGTAGFNAAAEVIIMRVTKATKWWALAALSLSVLVVALDLFVLTLALPTLSADLHASSSDLQWFVDAYSLVLAAAMLPAGLFGDRIGRKRLLLAALALFGLASAACAYSTSAGELIAARAVLGFAAAVIMPLSLSVLPVLFTPEERPRAIAAVGGATFLGYPIGPILGGWLLDHFWWGSVFLINVPVVIIALVAVTTLMPESRGERASRIDLAGIALSSAGLASLTYGLINAGENGWTDPVAVTTMSAGAVLLAGFVAWERRAGEHRLVDLGLFSSAGFTWGTILSTLVSFALFGLFFAMPLYFRDVRGLNSLGTGLRMLPMVGGLAVGLMIGQRLQSPRKARPTPASGPGTANAAEPGPAGAPMVGANIGAAAGFAIIAGALAAGAGTTITSGTGFAAAWFAVTGFGLGVAMPIAMNAALGALSPARSGSGSAVITAMRQVGGTIGVAVLGTVLATVYRGGLRLAGIGAALPARAAAAVRSSVAGGVGVAHALTAEAHKLGAAGGPARAGSAALLGTVRTSYVHGLDVMLWVCAGIAVASALLALAFLPSRAAGSGRPTSQDGAAPQDSALVTGSAGPSRAE
jgi:MFS transporter, DHA2 family, multidrug resistance protein